MDETLPRMAQKHSNSHRQVLVVEDDPVSLRLVCRVLEENGYKTRSCKEADSAMSLLQEQSFSFMITDWNMPGMSGLDLCRRVRAQERTGYLYTILLTARDSREDLLSGLGAGADDYLTKPLDRQELLARMQTGMRFLRLEEDLRRANREIQELANRDGLTGCYNRAYLNLNGPREVARARRYGRPLSLIMVDIDHFKRINDSLGHLAGDAILKSFVLRLQEGLREGMDWMARYGGEEFVIVLPETCEKDAVITANRLQGKLEGESFHLEGRPVRVTASFGVGDAASLENENYNFDELLRHVDNLLLHSKERGRNRVTTSLAGTA